MTNRTPGLLFLCVANSARSQIAEGLARAHFGERVRVQSAGSKPSTIHPFAVRALAEVGIDISSQWSKSVMEIDPFTVDLVITLCADEVCPVFLGSARKIHWPLPDPIVTAGLTDDVINPFRKVRNEIARRLADLDFP